MNILTVNAGSTSMKVDLVRDGVAVSHWDALDPVAGDPSVRPQAVAHRFVHGGRRTAPVVVDADVRRELDELVVLDPLHLPPALDALEAARAAWPTVPHVVCFDTAFHVTIPAARRSYALPQPWRGQLPAYGFHGLSHSWSAHRLAELAPAARRSVVAHLGGGSSLCGIVDGRSEVTTMGFTPLDGLVMATRPGSLDPGAVLWLARQPGLDLEDLLTRRSGLAGLTGTPDMREVLARARSGDGDASFALDLYEQRFGSLLGGCVATIGGIDALVFTGRIGEAADALRSRLLGRLDWLGVEVDTRSRPRGESDWELSAVGSRLRVFVIRSAEHLVLARDTEHLVGRP